jgi:hypothetical protein
MGATDCNTYLEALPDFFQSLVCTRTGVDLYSHLLAPAFAIDNPARLSPVRAIGGLHLFGPPRERDLNTETNTDVAEPRDTASDVSSRDTTGDARDTANDVTERADTDAMSEDATRDTRPSEDAGRDAGCSEGETRECSTSVGVCEVGGQTCEDGQWGPCSGQTSSEETCDGADNDCDGMVDEDFPNKAETYYRDRDGDGYGDPDTSEVKCQNESGWVINSNDCYDQNADAKPGQEEWFATDRGDGSFDYNCDGNEQPKLSTLHECDGGVTYELDNEGWAKRPFPDCGETGRWITDCEARNLGCSPSSGRQRPHECR